MEIDDSREYNRKIVSFKDLGRFKLTEKRYNDDSLNVYTARLNDLREDTLRRAKLKWSKLHLPHTQNLSMCYLRIIPFYIYYSRSSTCRSFTFDPGKPRKVLYFDRSTL